MNCPNFRSSENNAKPKYFAEKDIDLILNLWYFVSELCFCRETLIFAPLGH